MCVCVCGGRGSNKGIKDGEAAERKHNDEQKQRRERADSEVRFQEVWLCLWSV